MPPSSVFPEECIRPRYRKPAHPAPWMVALLPALAHLGKYECRVFLTHRSIAKPCVVERDGVTYVGVPSPVPERFGRTSLYHQYSFAVKGPVRKFAPDLIHAFGFETGAALIALRTGLPVSTFIQGIVEDYFPYYKNRSFIDRHVGRWGERTASKRVRWMVAETEYAKAWARKANPGVHVSIIPHPLRPIFLDKAEPTYPEVVFTAGTLEPRKGVDVIIRAFARVGRPEARLVIAGGGGQRQELEALATDLKVAERVEFTGPLATESIIERMNGSRVFVIASHVDTSPNVLTEAHAIGLPVIGTRGGGIPEMIDDGIDGYVIDVADDHAMAGHLNTLLSDVSLARRLGAAGREKVTTLNAPSRIAEQHAQFFEHIRKELSR
jgi:glycosyltransferase involved in cell wall biosynthesis